MAGWIRSTMLPVAAALLLAACTPSSVRAPVETPPPVAPAQAIVDTGEIEGAQYRIDIPTNWNGELVVNAHGYETVGSPRSAPQEFPSGMEPLLAQGFAIAASGYSAQGWAIAEGVADTERLRAHFVARHGTPTRTWLVGWSMGGLIALASAERHPRAYDGVVSMCGVALSSEALMASGALRPLAAYDALFPKGLPQAPGGLADPTLPAMPDGDAIEAALAGDEARAAVLATRFSIPREDLAGSLWLYYVVLRELGQRAGGFPVSSTTGVDGTEGDETALRVQIRRYSADPDALAYVRATGALTGAAPVPVVLQPNAVDPIVTARLSGAYVALARQAGREAQLRVLPGVGESHCRFPPDTVSHALATLRAH